MANACVDANDFQTDAGGRLQLNPSTLASPTASFVRTLLGAANVYAELPDIAALVVAVPGKYVVAWDAHGNATNTTASPGTPVNTTAMVGLGLNNALVGGTETMIMLNSQGGPTTQEPAYQIHATGSGTEILDLIAGDELSLFAARASDAGTTTEIISNTQGRTRLRAWRIGPS